MSIGDHLYLLLAQYLCWALRRHLGGTSVGPVPEPGHLRRAGLSQSWPEPVPRRFLREYPPAELDRQNGQLARPHSVGRCADRREIPCTEGANAAELV